MKLFHLRMWPFGPNLIACGLYVLRGHWTLLLWLGGRDCCVPVMLPVRASVYAMPTGIVTGRGAL